MFYRVMSSVLLLTVLFVNYTSSGSIGDLSVLFPFDIMPPGLSFAVAWGLIYLGLIIFHVFSFAGSKRELSVHSW